MSRPDDAWSDGHIVHRIGNLLQVGVLASALVILAGGILFLARHGHEPEPDRTVFHPEPPEFTRPAAVVRSALSGRGRALIQLGLLLLIATPVMRVLFSIYAFARQRDRVYVVLPLIVLAVLLYGLFSGHLHE